jgi:phosphate starvation-inducible PhoH-like protein
MSEATIHLVSQEEAVLLFGTRDQNLRAMKEALGVKLIARGNSVHIEGTDEQVDQTERVFHQLRQLAQRQGKLAPADVKTVIDVIQHGGEAIGDTSPGKAESGKYARPRTDGQGRYVRAMQENDLTFCIGPAGTGKTYLAVAMAVNLLKQGHVKKIVLVRPAVEAGERLGFLPGDIVAKVNPYLRPLFDALNDLLDSEQVKRYMDNDIIEIVPLAFMRGRTLNQAVIILDEGQNATVPQMKMFLTRMGLGSKIMVTGDITQVDLPKQMRNGLVDAIHRLGDLDHIAVVYLDEHDIVRHPLVQRIVRAYDEERPKGKRSRQ